MKKTRIIALMAAMMMVAVLIVACSRDSATEDDEPTNEQQAENGEETQQGEQQTEETQPGDDQVLGRAPFVPPATISTELPRNETLYFMGFNWGPPIGWNPFSNDMNNPLVHEEVARGARLTMFETPFMFNALNGDLIPLLAYGPYRWNDDLTQLEYTINPNAFWSDGTKITAHDAAFTYDAGLRYGASGGVAFGSFIDRVVAVDNETVRIYATLTPDGRPANPLMITTFLVQNYIMQEAWLRNLIERNNGDFSLISQDPGLDVVWSGPFGPYFFNDEIVVLIRDDGYWGQHPSMWGTLPAPRFIAHPIFEDNAAGDAAFAAGLVDVSQNFIANVQNMWLQQGLPISTFMDEPPYGMALSLPTAFFNMNSTSPGIDNPAVRRAIAMAVDYDLIIANAMTNQSPSFRDIPRSLMNPTPGEQALFDSAQVAHLQWPGNEIEEANRILDEAGIERDADGWRHIDGVRLSYLASVPYGWSDWEAAMEIVAAAGQHIGIEITTRFDDWSVYSTIVTSAVHTEYDIFMMWTDDASPAQPWGRIRNLLSSEFVGVEGNWSGNWGHFSNARVDELIAAIPLETNQAIIVDMYTELVYIYLTEVPSFTLMYRPAQFHTINESVWTGFTEYGDGRNVPPLNAVNGYAIADLFNIRLVNP
ncbi:MAG: ABC transporter substrate-binding protein [Defluviitaleaceae bacterium]|nr:ABC transporter substrate-binding protein [Defluviitaleaceae bacterium]